MVLIATPAIHSFHPRKYTFTSTLIFKELVRPGTTPQINTAAPSSSIKSNWDLILSDVTKYYMFVIIAQLADASLGQSEIHNSICVKIHVCQNVKDRGCHCRCPCFACLGHCSTGQACSNFHFDHHFLCFGVAEIAVWQVALQCSRMAVAPLTASISSASYARQQTADFHMHRRKLTSGINGCKSIPRSPFIWLPGIERRVARNHSSALIASSKEHCVPDPQLCLNDEQM